MLINILIGLIVIGVTVSIQGYGTGLWLSYISKKYFDLSTQKFVRKKTQILILTAFFILILHFIQANIWALTYLFLPGITELESLEKAVYFSLVTFTTLGYGEITLGASNRILAGFEAINGILLIGWSTAFMFSVVQFIWKRMFEIEKAPNK